MTGSIRLKFEDNILSEGIYKYYGNHESLQLLPCPISPFFLIVAVDIRLILIEIFS
jgi:hypothetical protein